jgi:MFS family permease
MNLGMAFYRAPATALMPDIVPSAYRSQASGWINFLGGLGGVLAYLLGKPLYDANPAYPFFAMGGLSIVASLLVVAFIREQAPAGQKSTRVSVTEALGQLRENLRNLVKGEKSLLFLLLAILFWFISIDALVTFFTSYSKFHLDIPESTGALIFGFFALTFMLMAIPAGYIGARFGRKKAILAGLFLLTGVMLAAIMARSIPVLASLFSLGGVGFALVNVNCLPMVFDMTPEGTEGNYTGLYYFFSQSASIIAPPLAGACIDLLGYPSLIVFSALFLASSLILMVRVRSGEARIAT